MLGVLVVLNEGSKVARAPRWVHSGVWKAICRNLCVVPYVSADVSEVVPREVQAHELPVSRDSLENREEGIGRAHWHLTPADVKHRQGLCGLDESTEVPDTCG